MNINPIQAEIDSLSPGAKGAIGMAGYTLPPSIAAPDSQLAAQAPMITPAVKLEAAQDPGPAPNLAPIKMPGADPIPNLGNPAMPNVTSAPSRLALDQKELGRKIDTGSGESQISSRIQGTQFGQNHPLLGKILGGATQGLATLGDIGLSAVAPALAVNLPGTAYHHALEVGQGNRQVANDEANEEKQAQTANLGATTQHTQTETAGLPQEQADNHDLSQSQQSNLDSETNARNNPTPDYEVHDTAQGPMVVNKKTGIGQHLSANGIPIGPKVVTKVVPLQIGGEDHQVLINDADGTVIKDLGKGGVKPPSVHVDNGTHNLWSVPQPDGSRKAIEIRSGDKIPAGAVSLSGQNSENVSVDKSDKAAQKVSEGLDSELALMKQFAAQPSPTNDAAMLMNYIGATKPESMGKIRLNDKEIKLFGGTRSSLGDVEALLTKVSNGQSLTPQQRNDMISTMTMIDQAAKRGGSSANPTQGNSTVAQPETRQYQGHTYVKGADGWVLQQ